MGHLLEQESALRPDLNHVRACGIEREEGFSIQVNAVDVVRVGLKQVDIEETRVTGVEDQEAIPFGFDGEDGINGAVAQHGVAEEFRHARETRGREILAAFAESDLLRAPKSV